MTTGEITIRDLGQLLRDQGFTAGSRLGNSRRYNHKGAGAWILLPVDGPARAVPGAIVTVRAHLDQLGLLGRDDFDEWMWRLIIARKDAAAKNGRPSANGHGAPAAKPKDRKRANGTATRAGSISKRPGRRAPRAGVKGPA